jgi:hypothetical protein
VLARVFVTKCLIFLCSVNADNNVIRSTPCIPVSWLTETWSKVGIDIVGELSDVLDSERFVITLTTILGGQRFIFVEM